MSLSFKEFSCTDLSQQLLCTVHFLKDEMVAVDYLEALRKIKNCSSATLIEKNKVILASDSLTHADNFLRNLEDVLLSLPVEAFIEETRIGRVDDLENEPTLLSNRFNVASPEYRKNTGDSDTIYLENGSIFGSGHHPSTQLAVLALEECFQNVKTPTVLDVGCGSGVISFVADRLGAQSVLGIDINQDAIEIAKTNKNYNDLLGEVQFFHTFLADVEQSFDIVIANISPSVLQKQVVDIQRVVSVGGKVILSGFQVGQVEGFVKQMEKLSCRLENTYESRSWRALTFFSETGACVQK